MFGLSAPVAPGKPTLKVGYRRKDGKIVVVYVYSTRSFRKFITEEKLQNDIQSGEYTVIGLPSSFKAPNHITTDGAA